MDITTMRLIEELAANAWPAAVTQAVTGWRLRFNWGVTRRANSVWPNEDNDTLPLADKLVLVEDFYARRGLPARFQVCPAALPVGLEQSLAERGYTSDAPTLVQTADLATVLQRVQPGAGARVRIDETINDTWFETYRLVEQLEPRDVGGQRGILERIGPRTGYALAEVEGQPAAVGLGVMERGWIGIFCMGTRVEFRRQGAAQAIIHSLATWGQAHNVSRMYLQVMEKNEGAQRLYASAGFETLYGYHYREQHMLSKQS